MRGRVLPLAFIGLALIGLGLLGGSCGEPNSEENSSGPQATLTLVGRSAPLGLQYGEQVTLLLRYHRQNQPVAGVILTLRIAGDKVSSAGAGAGATLSADRVVTNDYGQASVLLTAGAAEAAFHVLCSAPLAEDLRIDIAVSKDALGSLDALLDATDVPGNVALVRAALVIDTPCTALAPLPMLPDWVTQKQQASTRMAVLTFPNLLVRPYGLIGRAEDASKRLLAYGCIDLPEQLLRTGLRATVQVPLSPIFPSPLGSYALTIKLQSQPPMPSLWELLACANGPGQVLLDEMLRALPVAERDLMMRLAGLRATSDSSGCRLGTGKLDERLQALLAATMSGDALIAVAQDGAALQKGLKLSSELRIYAATGRELLGAHTLQTATLSTGTRSAVYSLATVPVPSASELLLSQSGAVLTVPEHPLTLRLPALWRRALDDLALVPRGLTMTPQQLFQSAVNSAQSGSHMGCDAVEAVLCNGVAAPCVGKLYTPCMTAATAAAAALSAALADAAPEFDLWLAQTLTMMDPDGLLMAQTLEAGQVSGRTTVGSGTLPLTGSSNGTRTAL